jgi:hypothetical protein
MRNILEWLQHNKEWDFSGAGVSVIILISSLFRRTQRRSPSLQVQVAFGFLTHGPRLSDQMILFTVANPSDRPVKLTSINVPLKNETLVFPVLDGERRLPCFVEPGNNVKFWVELAEVEEALRSQNYKGIVKIRAVATDALGYEYASNRVKVGK